MTLFVLTPDTVWNPRALEAGAVPKKVLHRVALLPRRDVGWGLILRTILENEPLRYFIALSPFVAAMFIWRDLALPISQAPLAMVIVIGVIEMKVLRVSKEARTALISQEDADRALDALTFRARAILSRLAAGRDMTSGELLLVVEQSELGRVTPLTLVSVQVAQNKRGILALDQTERAMLRDDLFDDDLTERALHATNLRDDTFVRTIAYDARAVSGHARLAAILATPPAQTDGAAPA